MTPKTQNAFDILDEELRNQPDGKKFLKQLDIIYKEIVKNRVDMSDICELAHELTAKECKIIGVPLEKRSKGEFVYTTKAQEIFNEIYNLIESKLNV